MTESGNASFSTCSTAHSMQIKHRVVQKSFSLPVRRYEQWNCVQERETWSSMQIFQSFTPNIHIPGWSPHQCHAEGWPRWEAVAQNEWENNHYLSLPQCCTLLFVVITANCFFFPSRQWLCYYRYLHAVPKHIHTAIQNNQPCFHGSKGCGQMKWVEITLNNLGIC